MVHEELADGKTLEEAISQQFLLRRWLDELVNGGWGFGTDEALTEVMDCTEDAGSVAECLRKVTGHEHQFAILRSGDFEYWIEYNADCRCVAPWGGQCNLKYYEERRR